MASNVVALNRADGDRAALFEAIQTYLVISDLSASTVEVYSRTLESLVEHLGSDAQVDNINRRQLEAFMADRYGHTQAATFNRNLATIGSFFAWCEDQELLVVSPARKLKRRKVRLSVESERQQRPIPQAELVALWSDNQHAIRQRALWAMLYETAARTNEVLGLNIEHLDLANKDAVVIGKGGDAERVYWASETARRLPRLIGTRKRGPLFLTERLPRSHVMPAAHDLCPDTGRARLSYHRALAQFKEASGGKTLHQLRHSALTHMAEDGESPIKLKAKSRHRSLRSLERYTTPSADSIRQMTNDHDVNRRIR